MSYSKVDILINATQNKNWNFVSDSRAVPHPISCLPPCVNNYCREFK